MKRSLELIAPGFLVVFLWFLIFLGGRAIYIHFMGGTLWPFMWLVLRAALKGMAFFAVLLGLLLAVDTVVYYRYRRLRRVIVIYYHG